MAALQRTGPECRPQAHTHTRPSLEDLATEADSLIAHSLATNTSKTYKTATDSLLRFRREYGFPDSWPVLLDQLINFVTYLSFTGLSPASVTIYISGIGYSHQARGLEDKTNIFLVTKIPEGLRRKRVKSSDVPAPVTLDLLGRLLQALQKVCTSNYEGCIFSSAFTLAFFALLRIGAITSDNKSDTGPHVICYEDISFSNKNEMYLRIRSSKADQRGNTITLIISEQKGSESDICPL